MDSLVVNSRSQTNQRAWSPNKAFFFFTFLRTMLLFTLFSLRIFGLDGKPCGICGGEIWKGRVSPTEPGDHSVITVLSVGQEITVQFASHMINLLVRYFCTTKNSVYLRRCGRITVLASLLRAAERILNNKCKYFSIH
jgi:hypothetical protein